MIVSGSQYQKFFTQWSSWGHNYHSFTIIAKPDLICILRIYFCTWKMKTNLAFDNWVNHTWFENKCSSQIHICIIHTVQLRYNFTLASNLLALVWSYLWHVVYYLRTTHTRLLYDLQEWFLTRLHIVLHVIDCHNVHRLVVGLVSHS